jgi:hypothetical protein
MRYRMRYLICIGMVILLVSIAFAIDISGNISGIWNPADNPYNITGDLRVPLGDTLIIEPGCFINFMGHYKLVVDTNALLIANGTEHDSIYFTAFDTLIGWHGLKFYKSDTNSQMSFCVFEYGKTDSQFITPYDDGGAIYCEKSNLNISNCMFRNNLAAEGLGGGICLVEGKLVLLNSTLKNNKSAFGGAGVYCGVSKIIIRDCFFDGDSTWYPLGGDFGGGITLSTCRSIEITGNTIRRCFSGQGGGGICIMSSLSDSVHVTISDNIIYDNKSLDVGAGLVVTNSIVDCSGNAIYGNTTILLSAAGVAFARCQLNLTNNSILYNHSAARGAAMWTRLGHTAMRNNIIWGNTDPFGVQIYCEEETISVAEYNDIQGGWPGIGNIDIAPKFVYPDTGNFNLSWANWPVNDTTKSPCIDTGDPSSPLDPDSTRADMGAFFYNQRWNDIDDSQTAPAKFELLDNYPNPFNSSTTIRYTIPVSGPVALDIYDILGRKVQTLIDISQQAGEYQAVWEADKVGSGFYFAKLNAGGQSKTTKLILLK